MKKIILIAVLAVVFLCTFLLVFFTGNNKSDKTPDETGDNAVTTPYDYDLSEYVTLGEFPKVKVEAEDIDDLVDGYIKQYASNFAEKKDVTDRPIKNGDTANIDYVGTLDGVAFEGGTAQGTDLVIGSGNFIPGFEEGLIGHSLGETVALDLTFPESYHNAEMAGKSVVFTVTINAITESIIPELTDTMVLAAKSEEYKTVAEFRVYLKKKATESLIWTNYVESCEVKKYPEKEIEGYTNNIISNYTAQASYYGTNLETLVATMGFSSLDQFKEYAKGAAEETAKAEMIVYQTMRKNNITVTDEEYKTIGLTVAKDNNYESIEKMEEAVGKTYITLSVYQAKIIEMAYKANGFS